MYADNIIERRIAQAVELYRQRNGGAKIELTRLSIADSIGRSAELSRRYIAAGFDKKTGASKLQWTKADTAFVNSEVRLCKADFRYWAERYGYCETTGEVKEEKGRVAPAEFWASQLRAMELLARREKECYEDKARHGFSSFLGGIWHKTRQQGATTLIRLMIGHRMLFYGGTRAVSGSLDSTRVLNMYQRDMDWYENVPFFMSVDLATNEKADNFTLVNNSRMTYQQANQEAGIATGLQSDASHMSEISLWPYPDKLKFDFLPAVPQSPMTLVCWESTANGKGGFWYEFTESVRNREEGFREWCYVFTPCYVNEDRNRLPPPEGWEMADITKQYAATVERTSHLYCDRTIRPSKGHLYWWETEYKQNKKNGTLHLFFSNYPATPEESFQYNASGALPVEAVQHLRSEADMRNMIPYAVRWNEHDSTKGLRYKGADTAVLSQDSGDRFPRVISVGYGGSVGVLERLSPAELDLADVKKDPRGIVWMREPPNSSATYFMGIDPTEGITGWSRESRVKEDRRTNNGAIEIIRRGKEVQSGSSIIRTPDVQVCEYAGPIDPAELGYVANLLGRIYHGKSDSKQCQCILEVRPGPGSQTMRMMADLGYLEFWAWQFYGDVNITESQKQLGWVANKQSVRDLWLKCSRHIVNQMVKIYSPWLAEEYGDARRSDDGGAYIPSNEKGHGDRMRAMNLAVWAANKWDLAIERTEEPIERRAINWAATDMSLEEIMEEWSERWEGLV